MSNKKINYEIILQLSRWQMNMDVQSYILHTMNFNPYQFFLIEVI